jgi:hypothetical protein
MCKLVECHSHLVEQEFGLPQHGEDALPGSSDANSRVPLRERGSSFCRERRPMAFAKPRCKCAGCRIVQAGNRRYVIKGGVAELQCYVLA